ncbi:hypothetical protein [Deefgea sp. CFH1-16]|uniref:hypothetical protein n=1 Tax=Deefgea sp. CFH1-16 TaxID=2675457 RepID=UPI0015F76084|nr:hypothetical protein [Deefgea sp. CFH1-16]
MLDRQDGILPELLDQIPEAESIAAVYCDGAYDTRNATMRVSDARYFDRQVAKLQVHAVILNRFTQLGTPTTLRVGEIHLGFGVNYPLADFCNKAA